MKNNIEDFGTLRKCWLNYDGLVLLEILRANDLWNRRGESIVLATIEGETEGKGRRDRRQMEWMDNIKTWEGGVEQAHRNARERRPTVH